MRPLFQYIVKAGKTPANRLDYALYQEALDIIWPYLLVGRLMVYPHRLVPELITRDRIAVLCGNREDDEDVILTEARGTARDLPPTIHGLWHVQGVPPADKARFYKFDVLVAGIPVTVWVVQDRN